MTVVSAREARRVWNIIFVSDDKGRGGGQEDEVKEEEEEKGHTDTIVLDFLTDWSAMSLD